MRRIARKIDDSGRHFFRRGRGRAWASAISFLLGERNFSVRRRGRQRERQRTSPGGESSSHAAWRGSLDSGRLRELVVLGVAVSRCTRVMKGRGPGKRRRQFL